VVLNTAGGGVELNTAGGGVVRCHPGPMGCHQMGEERREGGEGGRVMRWRDILK